jgi:hypothetical protein
MRIRTVLIPNYKSNIFLPMYYCHLSIHLIYSFLPPAGPRKEETRLLDFSQKHSSNSHATEKLFVSVVIQYASKHIRMSW